MPKAKDILEEIYDIRLSNKRKYHIQMQDLDASGGLGYRQCSIALFRLCELFDELEEEIKDIKDKLDHEITNRTGRDANASIQS